MGKLMNWTGAFLAAGLLLAGCGAANATDEPVLEENEIAVTDNGEPIHIIATLFPQFDFASQIGGDKVEVVKMLAPGIDAHTYEPSPQDMIALTHTDLFIYTSAEMEPWAQRLMDSLDTRPFTLDASQNVPLIPWGGHEDDDDDHDHHDHQHNYDPHIWTSPVNAIIMANNILDALIEVSPENEAYFRANAERLISELEDLDRAFQDVVDHADQPVIFHGGRFAMQYLTAQYGIDVVAAPNEIEPSAALVAQMITKIQEQHIPVIFFEELVDPQIANMIASETGAQALLLHTAHNLGSDQFQNGTTYVDLMRQNVENLRLALN